MVIIDESDAYLGNAFAAKVAPGFTDALNRRGYPAALLGCRLADFEQTLAVSHL